MSEKQKSTAPDVAKQVDEIPGLYQNWRNKVHGWISAYAPGELADAVLLVPDLFALVVRLIQDERVPLRFRGQLLLVAVYALSPIDIVPELAFGALGLADDAVLMSAMLLALLNEATQLDPALIREHWAGRGDIQQTVKEVVDNKGEIVNTKIWQKARNLFGNPSEEPTVVDGKRTRKSAES